jgi:hypothetical protein
LNKIRQVRFPINSLIGISFSPPVYRDAFSVTFYSPKPVEPVEVMKVFFTSMHPVVLFVFLLREGLARIFGLKTSNKKSMTLELRNFSGRVGESIGLLHVFNKSDNELLTGQDDKIVDFRLSFFSLSHGEETEIMIATCIKAKNPFGKFYSFLIKPFHKLMMPLVLKRLSRKFREEKVEEK